MGAGDRAKMLIAWDTSPGIQSNSQCLNYRESPHTLGGLADLCMGPQFYSTAWTHVILELLIVIGLLD